MKTYGLLALFMTIVSIVMSFTQSPLWMIGGSVSGYLAWQLLSANYFQKQCTEITKGKVLEIKANGTFLGGHHQPLHNAKIAYLDRVKVFKNLPPNFIHDVATGDIIEIKYAPSRPNRAFVNFLD